MRSPRFNVNGSQDTGTEVMEVAVTVSSNFAIQSEGSIFVSFILWFFASNLSLQDLKPLCFSFFSYPNL